jgi:hypothetical protein
MTMKSRARAAVVLFGLGLAACGGGQEAKAPVDDGQEESSARPSGPLPQVQQELGSIDQSAVERTFERLHHGPLEKCHQEGRQRVEYLSGDVKIFLRIDQAGKVRYGWLEESTLGDHETEACIFGALRRASWPKPTGGEAEVRYGFGWDPGDERAPTPWGPEKVLGALEAGHDVQKDVKKCKAGISGDFIVTGYVEHDDEPEPASAKPGKKHGKRGAAEAAGAGKWKSLGVSPPNKEGAEKVECVVDALKPLRLPTPGGYAAKVTFAL